jgi:hypothetical protein
LTSVNRDGLRLNDDAISIGAHAWYGMVMAATPPTLNQDFLDLLDEFLRARVEFMIVGAYALMAHGAPRPTGDLDVFVRASSENATRIMTGLHQFGAPLAAHSISAQYFEVLGNIYQIGLPPRRIDIINSLSGISFEQAWTSRIHTVMHGRKLAVLGRDALIRNKLASGRPKDLRDVKTLEKLPR